MADEALKQLFVQGLRALHAADEQGRVTAGDIAKAATNPSLKAALEEGSYVAQDLGRRVEQVFKQAGAQAGTIENDAIEGIATDAQRVREMEHDPKARDLGIIAHAQIALHYHMASSGTLRTYAQALGMKEAAQTLDGMLTTVEQQDRKFTQILESILG